MARQRIVILGGKGGGLLVAQAIKAGNAFELSGFLNDVEPPGAMLADSPILGRFDHWRECEAGTAFISAIAKPKHAFARLRRILSLGIPPGRWASVIHPRAALADDTIIGHGSFVGPFAVIEPAAVGGAHLCLRGGCYVSHDVRLGDYVFVGPNATVLSHCDIATGVHVGANAVCREGVKVGRYALIGAGAVVVRDVPASSIVAGNPARVIGALDTSQPA